MDFCAELGCSPTREALLSIQSGSCLLASRFAGKVAPIDGITTSVDDAELVRDDTRCARALGSAESSRSILVRLAQCARVSAPTKTKLPRHTECSRLVRALSRSMAP